MLQKKACIENTVNSGLKIKSLENEVEYISYRRMLTIYACISLKLKISNKLCFRTKREAKLQLIINNSFWLLLKHWRNSRKQKEFYLRKSGTYNQKHSTRRIRETSGETVSDVDTAGYVILVMK